jgi:hypothetical protein
VDFFKSRKVHLEEEEEDICEAQSTCVIRSKLEIVVNF